MHNHEMPQAPGLRKVMGPAAPTGPIREWRTGFAHAPVDVTS